MRMPSSRNKSINLFDSDVLLPPLLIGSSFVGWEDEMVIALHHIVLKKKYFFPFRFSSQFCDTFRAPEHQMFSNYREQALKKVSKEEEITLLTFSHVCATWHGRYLAIVPPYHRHHHHLKLSKAFHKLEMAPSWSWNMSKNNLSKEQCPLACINMRKDVIKREIEKTLPVERGWGRPITVTRDDLVTAGKEGEALKSLPGDREDFKSLGLWQMQQTNPRSTRKGALLKVYVLL